ncbi:hypothetical protein G7Y89_g9354 [Cudoniella acicularis]|uniref:Uncharacterized protein n=1 Tax=Cudoniella acicularis TaxID=354080 RepID=A0A8H4W2P0_9HELO|nr:hypothetical protein G7Y89_g9354 [Cudoniella acicularis]
MPPKRLTRNKYMVGCVEEAIPGHVLRGRHPKDSKEVAMMIMPLDLLETYLSTKGYCNFLLSRKILFGWLASSIEGLFKISYNIFRVAYLSAPRDRHTIFMETSEDGPRMGFLYQVTGDIQSGMTYDYKKARKPEESTTFASKEFLRTVTFADYPRVAKICNDITLPKKQFQMNRRLYPHEAIRRCQEWTAEAVQALREAGVL